MTLAFVFPGQGSQSVGMLAELAHSQPQVEATYAEASRVLGYDLWALVQQGPEADLNLTCKTQPAMLAAGVAAWRVWQARGGTQPAYLAGHSLGEYTALVCAGALEFTDAVDLVARRGEFMQAAVAEGSGAMAAILGLDDAEVRAVCAEAAQGAVVEAVNFNSPGQVVVAGETAAVARALELAKQAGAKRAVLLPVSVPSHCALMRPAAEQLGARLRNTVLQAPRIPVINNVDVAAYDGAESIRDGLTRQLYQPVRWAEVIQALAQKGVGVLVECGPGKVLTGLNKRIVPEMKMLPLHDPATLAAALAAVA
ncbi:MAG: ACP S-malonyltransferase [Gammaproteobacteria bacterium]|nr:ACP S-malonyltransferase [Gammaproteobacteria bacterium]